MNDVRENQKIGVRFEIIRVIPCKWIGEKKHIRSGTTFNYGDNLVFGVANRYQVEQDPYCGAVAHKMEQLYIPPNGLWSYLIRCGESELYVLTRAIDTGLISFGDCTPS